MNTQNTAMMERTPFLLPDVAANNDGFTKEELAQDIEGLQLGFQLMKIPSGGQLQFELTGEDPDNPDYTKFLEGIILYSHNANAYWAGGKNDSENTPPDCQSMDGKIGYGCPGGLCADCAYNRFGSDTDPKGTGRGKACKNQRIIYLLRSGEVMPIQLSLSPTSLRPYSDFVNAAFVARRRGVCGSVVQIGLKKRSNGKDDYSVATFKRPYDGTSDLTLYAVVVLHTSCGVRFVYRTSNMHGCLVGYKAPCFAFDSCMAHLLQDACGKMVYTSVLPMQDAA